MLLNKLFKSPPPWLLIFAYILTLICSVGSILMVLFNKMGTIAYIVFALAGITLAYSIYTLVRFFPKIKLWIKARFKSIAFAKSYINSFGYRAFINSIISLSFGIIFSIFNGVLGIMAGSIWYGALATYYIIISAIYGSLVLGYKKERNANKIYRRCGILLLTINLALSSAIGQMIFNDEAFEYYGLTIYAFALFAFYKITVAIINLFKVKKLTSQITKAIVLINLTSAMVSILALQTALLSTFGNDVNASLFNTLTGSFVSIATLGISIYMIIASVKKYKTGDKNERK